MESKRFIGSWLFIGACLLAAGGCSTGGQSERSVAIAQECTGPTCTDDRSNGQIAWLGPQIKKGTQNYYASHCDEQTRQVQHELANCVAVPLVNIPLDPSPHS
jgi:hypothetical protein